MPGDGTAGGAGSADGPWEVLERADLAAWHGLPAPAPYAELTRRFPPLVEQEARVLLGSDKVEAAFRVHVGERYPRHLTVSYLPAGPDRAEDGAEVVLVEAELPQLAQPMPELQAALGEPAARLELRWGVLTVAGGLHVHPARGLAVGVGPEGQVLRVALFAAGDLDTYLRTRHHAPRPPVERP